MKIRIRLARWAYDRLGDYLATWWRNLDGEKWEQPPDDEYAAHARYCERHNIPPF